MPHEARRASRYPDSLVRLLGRYRTRHNDRARPVIELRFTVLGLPAPQGSKRHVGNGVMVESSKKVKPWREDVKQAAQIALDRHPEWDRTAIGIHLDITFTVPRPRSHYGTGRNANLLRDNAPQWSSSRPDLDKLVRSTADALTTVGVYHDDSRICELVAAKVYQGTRLAWLTNALDVPGAAIIVTSFPV